MKFSCYDLHKFDFSGYLKKLINIKYISQMRELLLFLLLLINNKILLNVLSCPNVFSWCWMKITFCLPPATSVRVHTRPPLPVVSVSAASGSRLSSPAVAETLVFRIFTSFRWIRCYSNVHGPQGLTEVVLDSEEVFEVFLTTSKAHY